MYVWLIDRVVDTETHTLDSVHWFSPGTPQQHIVEALSNVVKESAAKHNATVVPARRAHVDPHPHPQPAPHRSATLTRSERPPGELRWRLESDATRSSS